MPWPQETTATFLLHHCVSLEKYLYIQEYKYINGPSTSGSTLNSYTGLLGSKIILKNSSQAA